VFAHNGNMPGVMADSRLAPGWNLPLGETDSERAFCALMDRLRQALAPGEVFNLNKKLPVIQGWANALAQHGMANFLLSDSQYLYAHYSTRLFYTERQCEATHETFGSPTLRIALSPEQDGARHVSLIATEPLTTDEAWISLPPGEVVVFQHGRRIFP
jgi:glutamine amidotransferase